MYGEIIETVISGLRTTPIVKAKNIAVVLTSDDEEGTVNTTLPAIAVTIMNSDDAQVYIGGVIEDRIQIQLAVIVDLANYSWSKDGSFQADMISLGREVRNAFEQLKNSSAFRQLRDVCNFNPQYRGFKTYKRIALRKQLKSEVMVVELQYITSVIDGAAFYKNYGQRNVETVKIKDVSDCDTDRETIIPRQEKKSKKQLKKKK